MEFEKAYKNFLDGTATPEETEFVRSEMKKARELSFIINGGSAFSGGEQQPDAVGDVKETPKAENRKPVIIENADDGKIRKATKTFNTRMFVRTVCTVLITVVAISGIALGSIFGIAAGSASKNTKITREDAETIAIDYVKKEFSVENVRVKDTDRDLEMSLSLTKSYYQYEIELNDLKGTDYELTIDGRNGNVLIVDVDRD